MEPYPASADAGRLAAVGTEQALRFRDALRAPGFAAAAESFPTEVEGRARGGRNIPRVMRITAAGRPLDTFVRLFLMGVPTGVREARTAMAPVPLEEWVAAGLVHAEGDSVRGLVALYLYEGLIVAADKPELLDGGAGPDIVSGLMQCKLRMAPGLALETARTWSGEAWSDAGYWLRQGAGFRFQASVDAHVADMLKTFEGPKTVREVLEEVAGRLGVSFDAVARGSLAALGEMLQRGFLVVE